MSDAAAPAKPLSRDFRTGMIVGVLALSIIGLVLLNVFGDDENAIHTMTTEGCLWLIAFTVSVGTAFMVTPAVLSALPWGRK